MKFLFSNFERFKKIKMIIMTDETKKKILDTE